MTRDPNSKEDTQVVFFKNNPITPKKSQFLQRIGWFWYLISVVVLLRLLQVTENFWLTLAASIAVVFAFRWRKIVEEIDEDIKRHGTRNALTTVINILFIKIVIYAIGLSFLFTLAMPLACNIQDSMGIKFFSNRFCENSFTNLKYQLYENRY